MLRFSMWLMFVVMFTTAATAAVIAYGQRQPYESPMLALGYAMSESIPSYSGVIPSQTLWTEAQSRFAGSFQPEAYDPKEVLKWFNTKNVKGYIVIGVDHDLHEIVERITVSPGSQTTEFPTLRDVLLFYGAPCSVYTVQSDGNVTRIGLNYPFILVDLPRSSDRLTFERRPEFINLQGPQVNRCDRVKDTQQWRGLTAYNRYLLD